MDLASAWALSQPAKSGAPPSSKVEVEAEVVVTRVVCMAGVTGASKKGSSPISPHASSSSSSSTCASPKKCSVFVRMRTGAGIVDGFVGSWRFGAVMGPVAVSGVRVPSVEGVGGTEEE